MDRNELLKELNGRYISDPEKLCEGLTDGAIEGTIRWWDHQRKMGKQVGSGLLAQRLKAGGMEGFGITPEPRDEWWRSSPKRWEWMERNLPDLPDFLYAEAAILQLVNKKQEPNPESVKALARRLEREQLEYEAHR